VDPVGEVMISGLRAIAALKAGTLLDEVKTLSTGDQNLKVRQNRAFHGPSRADSQSSQKICHPARVTVSSDHRSRSCARIQGGGGGSESLVW
jgi:hypothetical protein